MLEPIAVDSKGGALATHAVGVEMIVTHHYAQVYGQWALG